MHVSLCESCCKDFRKKKRPCPSCSTRMKNYKKLFFQEPETEELTEATFENPNSSSVIDKNLCIICFTLRNELFVLEPCMHVSLCQSCCKNFRKKKQPCPSCRKPIQEFKKISFQKSKSDFWIMSVVGGNMIIDTFGKSVILNSVKVKSVIKNF